jgi:hypothetical protein
LLDKYPGSPFFFFFAVPELLLDEEEDDDLALLELPDLLP